jgi:hypothetical protein
LIQGLSDAPAQHLPVRPFRWVFFLFTR